MLDICGVHQAAWPLPASLLIGWKKPSERRRDSKVIPLSRKSSLFQTKRTVVDLKWLAAGVSVAAGTVHLLNFTTDSHGDSSSLAKLRRAPIVVKCLLTVYVSIYTFHKLEAYALRNASAYRNGCRHQYIRFVNWISYPVHRDASWSPTRTITESFFVDKWNTALQTSARPSSWQHVLPQFAHFNMIHLFLNCSSLLHLTDAYGIVGYLGTPYFLVAYLASGYVAHIAVYKAAISNVPFQLRRDLGRRLALQRELSTHRDESLRAMKIELYRQRPRQFDRAFRSFMAYGTHLSRLSECGPSFGASAGLCCLRAICALISPFRVSLASILLSTLITTLSPDGSFTLPLMVLQQMSSDQRSQLHYLHSTWMVPTWIAVATQTTVDALFWATGTAATVGHRAHILGTFFGLGTWYGILKWVHGRQGSFATSRKGPEVSRWKTDGLLEQMRAEIDAGLDRIWDVASPVEKESWLASNAARIKSGWQRLVQ